MSPVFISSVLCHREAVCTDVCICCCKVDFEHVVCGFVYLPVILRAFTQAWIRCACPRRSLLMIRALQRRHELIKYIEQRAED